MTKTFNLSNQSQLDVFEGMKIWANNFVEHFRSVVTLAKANFGEWKEFGLIFSDSPPDCGTVISDILACCYLPSICYMKNINYPLMYIP